jgi:aspartate/methionine/tyrosine aminotransferase
VHLPFRPDYAGLPDVGDAAARITGRTRAIVLVTPNNPTGAVYPPEVVDAFFELARRNAIALVVDETYRDFRDDDGPPHGLFRRADWPGTLVHLYSFSKVYALTGYRVGAAVCGGELRAGIAKAMDCVAICAPRIGQEAALFGLEGLGPWRSDKRLDMRRRAAALREAFQRNDIAYELVSAGGFFAYLRHPFAGVAGVEVARRLAEDQNLLCLPGGMFGPGQDPFLRLAFANVDAETMPEIARRLVASQV